MAWRVLSYVTCCHGDVVAAVRGVCGAADRGVVHFLLTPVINLLYAAGEISAYEAAAADVRQSWFNNRDQPLVCAPWEVLYITSQLLSL